MSAHILISLATSAGGRYLSHQALAQMINDMLNDLGVQEFDNARQALWDAERSYSPRHELTNAINHLQSAVSLFESKIQREFKKGHGVFDFSGGPNYSVVAELNRKQYLCYAMITTIYAKLEERDLMLKYATLFGKTFRDSLELRALSSKEMRYMDNVSVARRSPEIEPAKLFLLQLGAPLSVLGRLVDDPGAAQSTSVISSVTPSQKTSEDWNNEGTNLLNLKRYEEALAAFEEALFLKTPSRIVCKDGWTVNKQAERGSRPFLNTMWQNRNMQWRYSNAVRKKRFERHLLHRENSNKHLPLAHPFRLVALKLVAPYASAFNRWESLANEYPA